MSCQYACVCVYVRTYVCMYVCCRYVCMYACICQQAHCTFGGFCLRHPETVYLPNGRRTAAVNRGLLLNSISCCDPGPGAQGNRYIAARHTVPRPCSEAKRKGVDCGTEWVLIAAAAPRPAVNLSAPRARPCSSFDACRQSGQRNVVMQRFLRQQFQVPTVRTDAQCKKR